MRDLYYDITAAMSIVINRKPDEQHMSALCLQLSSFVSPGSLSCLEEEHVPVCGLHVSVASVRVFIKDVC